MSLEDGLLPAQSANPVARGDAAGFSTEDADEAQQLQASPRGPVLSRLRIRAKGEVGFLVTGTGASWVSVISQGKSLQMSWKMDYKYSMTQVVI